MSAQELSLEELEKVADAYERLLAPALFKEWAYRVADAAEIQPGQHVLDVACGTGVLTRPLVLRVEPGGLIVGMDINPGMLAVAGRIEPSVEWRQGDAQALPYDDESFDVVVCQFGLMLFPEPDTALREMQRVLKPGGRMVVAVFGSLDELPAYEAMADTYARLIDENVGSALRMPFSMGDTDRLNALFADAGIDDIAVATSETTARFSTVRHMVLSDVLGWFPFAGFNLSETQIDTVVREAEKILAPFRTDDGGVEFDVPAHIVTATKT